MAIRCRTCSLSVRDYRIRGLCSCFFGLGLALSCFCPQGLVLFFAAVIITALSIGLLLH